MSKNKFPYLNKVERLSDAVTKAAGSSLAFIFAFLSILTWAACGPFTHYSENWQLAVNTTTTIITFLMVFLIQKAQNKESVAVQIKLNELIAASPDASNRLVNAEVLTEEELMILRKHYETLAESCKQNVSLNESHSVEEAINNTQNKIRKELNLPPILTSKKEVKP